MRICVGAILVYSNKILLVKRSDHQTFCPGVWDVPGGHCLPGESLDHALVRELDEELGVAPVRFALRTELSEPNPEQRGDGVYHMFVVQAWRGAPSNRDANEHSQIAWFSLADACELTLAHPHYLPLFRSVLSDPN